MKNYTDSDYALNKYSEGIVYRFADEIVVVTLQDYLRENPNKTGADFTELKALSDNDYYEQDKRDYRQTWKNISIDALPDEVSEVLESSDPTPEDVLFHLPEQEGNKARMFELANTALDKLTTVQRRRYLLHHVHGKTLREIAKAEGTNFAAIQQSLLAAEKKIKVFISNS